MRIVPLVEDQLVLVVESVRDLVLFSRRHWRRREQWVHSDPNENLGKSSLLYRVFDHGWNEPREVGRRQLEAGVGVDFDQPRLEVLVKHKVVSENFKRELAPLRVHLPRDSLDGVLNELLHFRD